MRNNFAETGSKVTLRDSSTYCHHMPLSERTGSILYTSCNIHLRMTGSHALPLTEILKILHRVFATKGEHTIKHRRHMARIKEEAVASEPFRIFGIIHQKTGIKHIDKISRAHCAARMTGLGFLDHLSYENTKIVGSLIHYFYVHWNRMLLCCLVLYQIKRSRELLTFPGACIFHKNQRASNTSSSTGISLLTFLQPTRA